MSNEFRIKVGTLLIPIVLIFSSILLVGCSHLEEPTPTPTPSPTPSPASMVPLKEPEVLKVKPEMLIEVKKVKINLENGLSFSINVYPKIAPNTAKNFLDKFQSGYYHGLTFHRVEDWVAQGGDPKGDGSGGGKILTELNDQKFTKGSVGVARSQDIKESNDSQFFIVTKDSEFLNEKYDYFGQVPEGMENVLKIKIGDKIKSTKIL